MIYNCLKHCLLRARVGNLHQKRQDSLRVAKRVDRKSRSWLYSFSEKTKETTMPKMTVDHFTAKVVAFTLYPAEKIAFRKINEKGYHYAEFRQDQCIACKMCYINCLKWL